MAGDIQISHSFMISHKCIQLILMTSEISDCVDLALRPAALAATVTVGPGPRAVTTATQGPRLSHPTYQVT